MGRKSERLKVISKASAKAVSEKSIRGGDSAFIQWLVVVCVVGVVALLGLLQVRKNQVAQRDLQRKADLARAAQSVGQYYADHKKYPQTVDLPKDPHKQLYYVYRISENGLRYRLFARLENSKDSEVVATDADCGARCNYEVTP